LKDRNVFRVPIRLLFAAAHQSTPLIGQLPVYESVPASRDDPPKRAF
jgi:hypothetical protein